MLLTSSLKDDELRNLQLFLCQSSLLSQYFERFAGENITKDILAKSDDSMLKFISDQFKMKIGEYAALKLLVRQCSPQSPFISKKKEKNISNPTDVKARSTSTITTTSSQGSLPSTTEVQERGINPNLQGEIEDHYVNESRSNTEEGGDLENIVEGPKPETEEYKDNTEDQFPAGKSF